MNAAAPPPPVAELRTNWPSNRLPWTRSKPPRAHWKYWLLTIHRFGARSSNRFCRMTCIRCPTPPAPAKPRGFSNKSCPQSSSRIGLCRISRVWNCVGASAMTSLRPTRTSS